MSGVEAYLEARNEFERVGNELNDLADLLATASNALRSRPDQMIFANTSQRLPVEANAGVSINANDWKSPDQIMGLLANYHKVKQDMLNLWGEIPENLQADIVAPNAPGRPRETGTIIRR